MIGSPSKLLDTADVCKGCPHVWYLWCSYCLDTFVAYIFTS